MWLLLDRHGARFWVRECDLPARWRAFIVDRAPAPGVDVIPGGFWCP